MTGFKPCISGVESNTSTNCATTTAQGVFICRQKNVNARMTTEAK